MAINKDDEVTIAFGGAGAVHYDTLFNAKQPVILGHTSPADTDRRFGGAIYLVFEALKRLQSDENNLLLLFALGDDSVSRLIGENLRQRGIQGVPMLVPGQPTASYTAIHDTDGNLVVAAICRDIYENVTVQMVSQHAAKLKQAKAWIFDSAFSHEVNTYLAMMAVEMGVDVYVVISSLASVGNVEPLLGKAKIGKTKAVFGNIDELKQLTGIYDDTIDGIKRILETIASWGTEVVFATRGSNGVMAYDAKNNKHHQFQAHPVTDVKTAHGAGDTFAAVVIHYLKQGKDVEWATKAAVIAAGLRVSGREKEISDKMLTQLMETDQKSQKKTKVKQISSLFKFTPQH